MLSKFRQSAPVLELLESRVQLSGGGAGELVHTTASLSLARWRVGATRVGHVGLFAGGFASAGEVSALDLYDSSTGTWSASTLPTASARFLATSVDGKAIFANGLAQSHGDSALGLLDVGTGQWSTIRYRRPVLWNDAVAVGSKAIFTIENTKATRAFAAVFDFRTNRWQTRRLPHPANVGVVGTQVVFNNSDLSLTIYDTTTGHWHTAPFPIRDATVGQPKAVGTKLFFSGYIDGTYDGVLIYDAVSGDWSTAKLSRARQAYSVASVGTKAIFAGGIDESDLSYSNLVDVYDVASGHWSSTALSQGRTGIGATTVGPRAVFAGGDIDITVSSFHPLDIVDIFTDTAPTSMLSGGIAGRPRGLATVTVFNTGDAPHPAGSTVTVYASPDRTLTGAVPLGQITLTDALPAGSSTQVKLKTSIPATLAPGTYHLLAAVDDHSGPAPTPIAAQARTFTVRREGAHTAASRFRGLFAQ
jgi:hypothetical protein